MRLRQQRTVVREIHVVDPAREDASAIVSDRLALFAALEELPPRQRAAVVLRYFHDYDYATIARILGTSTTNVGAMLSRGLDQLRIELDGARPAAAGMGR